jgi:serine/threonine-protein kinase
LQVSNYDAQYLPPEVLQGKPVSPAADQYALACALLETLAGKNPFAAPGLGEIEQKHLTPLVEPLFPPDNAPWQISRVLEQALSPEAGVRFKNASELAAALNRSTSPGAIPPGELARREAQVEAWRLSEQQKRQQDEESVRLAALEQARREIQEQAHREVEALELQDAETPESTAAEETSRPVPTRRDRRRPPRPGAWPALAIAAIILVALASYLLDKRLSTGDLTKETSTATTVVQPAVSGTDPGIANTANALASAIAPATVSSTPTRIFTPSASAKPLATLTRSSTATKKPTATPSLTPQPSPTFTPSITPTRTKPIKPDKKP